ncbi:hypothetical protein, partial [Azotobacter chroococcum]
KPNALCGTQQALYAGPFPVAQSASVSHGKSPVLALGLRQQNLGNSRIAWLNVTGSGNETSAHVQQDSRMTVMFCAFDGKPLILRLYGSAKVIHKSDSEWNDLFPLFKPLPGARQIFDVAINLVQASCGMAVPYFSYVGDRELLSDWAAGKGDEDLKRYWEEENQVSIDGIPTNIVERNG